MTAPEPTARTARWRTILIVVAAVLVAMLGFVTWYRFHFSMKVAQPFEVQGAPSGPRVLIATQGSAFKDAIVSGIVEHLKRRSAQVSVVDVSALGGVRDADWDAIVVIHTWEMHQPPPAVRAFVDRAPDRRKLVVLTTSGRGDFSLEGVDAISAASKMVDVPARVLEMSRRIDAVLDAKFRSQAP